jgi:hypothetical protein
MPEVDFLVLATSRKGGGRCIAGYDLDDGRWVRPVSNLREGTLTIDHCGIDGEWPDVFDIVRVEIAEAQPLPWQPENLLLADKPWQLIDRLDPAHARSTLDELLDYDVELLQSTNRTIAANDLRATPIDASLTMVKPDSLEWHIEKPPWGGRQEKARFIGDGFGHYEFHVTDIPVEEALHLLGFGLHAREAVGIGADADVYLTISLSEPFDRNDNCYKLAAAVIALPT